MRLALLFMAVGLLYTVNPTDATETPDVSRLSFKSRDRIRSALEILNRTQAGARVVRKLQLKMRKGSIDELMSVFQWGDVSKTDAVLTRHYDPASGVETREREVTVFLKRGAPIQDLLLDLAHEMTHASAPLQWDPYDPELTVVRYIQQALEAPGGEVDALFVECEVALELKDLSQGLGLSSGLSPDLSMDRCKRYIKSDSLNRESIQRDFYRVGNWKSKVVSGLSRFGAQVSDLPFLSSDSPKLYSSTGQAPYPVALIREFEDLNQAACENTRKRVDSLRNGYLKTNPTGARNPASVSPQVDLFLNKRCRLVITQAASLGEASSYTESVAVDEKGEPDTQIQLHKQAGYYRRANDVVSTDTIYYIRKLDLLGNATDNQLKTELKGFCIESPKKEPYETASLNHEKACLKRLKLLAAEHLQKNKAAMGRNENSIAELSSNSSKTPVVRNHLPTDDEMATRKLKAGFSTVRLDKKADNPELLTLQEIEIQNAKMRALASPQYQAALQKLPAEPSKDDFVKFIEVSKDKSDPKSEMISKIAKNPDGSIQYDMEAYENARGAYKAQKAAVEKDFDLQDRTQTTNGIAAQPAAYAPSGPLSKQAYEEARGLVIQALTKKEGKGKVSVPEQAKNRAPSTVPVTPTPPVLSPQNDDPYWASARDTGQKVKVIKRDADQKKTEIRVTIDPETIKKEVSENWKGGDAPLTTP